jgi:hypothetical protein
LCGKEQQRLVRLVELEGRDLLKVLEIPDEEGQVMLKTRCGNEDIEIPDLLPDRPWEAAPDVGKAFHDGLGKGKNRFPFQKASQTGKRRLWLICKGSAFVELPVRDNADCYACGCEFQDCVDGFLLSVEDVDNPVCIQ